MIKLSQNSLESISEIHFNTFIWMSHIFNSYRLITVYDLPRILQYLCQISHWTNSTKVDHYLRELEITKPTAGAELCVQLDRGCKSFTIGTITAWHVWTPVCSSEDCASSGYWYWWPRNWISCFFQACGHLHPWTNYVY